MQALLYRVAPVAYTGTEQQTVANSTHMSFCLDLVDSLQTAAVKIV